MTVFGEPAGRDPNSEQIRRIPNRGAGAGWAVGEYPPDCLRK